jgi:hypothetical protein
LAKVKSSAMTARHPEVPNLMTAGMHAAPESEKSE